MFNAYKKVTTKFAQPGKKPQTGYRQPQPQLDDEDE